MELNPAAYARATKVPPSVPAVILGGFATIAVIAAIVAIIASVLPHSATITYLQGAPVSSTSYVVAKYAAIVCGSAAGGLLLTGGILALLMKINEMKDRRN
jgi:hypothetical protein